MSPLPPALIAPLRSLLRARGHRLAVVGALAIGIGAALTADRTIGPLLRRPLPFPEADRLVAVWESATTGYGDRIGVGLPDFFDWRRDSPALDRLVASAARGVQLAGGGEPELLPARIVSSGYLELFGARFELGRGFAAADDEVGAPRAVVLSHGLWQRRFGGDPELLGRSVTLDGESFTVIGVTGRELRPPRRAELWLPLSIVAGNPRIWRSSHPLELVGRLAPGRDLRSAAHELDALARSVWSREPRAAMWSGWSVRLVALDEELVGRYRPALRALAIAVALLFALALANVAQLAVVRAVARRSEAILRVALGASRTRLIGEIASENLLLALVGGIVGAALAVALSGLLARLFPSELAERAALGSAGRLVVAALALSAVAGLVAAACAALVTLPHATGSGGSAARLGPGRGVTGGASRGEGRLGAFSVAAQVALGVPLVAAALVAGQALLALARVDPGFRAGGALTFRVSLPPALYGGDEERRRFLAALDSALAALPGVESVGFGSNIPASRQGSSAATSLFVAGRPRDGVPADGAGDVRAVSAGYFDALGLRLAAGRPLEPRDLAPGAPRVALVNASAARALFGGADPLGERIRDGNEPPPASPAFDPHFTIVGVVDDARSDGLAAPPVAELYLPWPHRPPRAASFVVRSAPELDPSSLAAPVRRALATIDPRLAPFDLAPLDALVAESIAGPRRALDLLALLAAAAALLGALGAYGLAAHRLARRRAELALRLAIGATPARLFGDTVAETVRFAALGGVIGALLAWQLGTLVARLCGLDQGVPAPAALAALALLLLASGLATLRPAVLALRTDPSASLRAE